MFESDLTSLSTRPKSDSFAFPPKNKMLSGFISRCKRLLSPSAIAGKMDNNTLDRRRPKRAKSSRNRIIQKLFQIFPSKKYLTYYTLSLDQFLRKSN